MSPVEWVTQQLTAAGYTHLPSLRPGEYFETTGFTVEASSAPGAGCRKSSRFPRRPT